MASKDSTAGQPVTFDAALREDALDVLHCALEWRLDAGRWTAVSAAVEALASGLQAGEVEAVRASMNELELAGPVRAVAVGDVATVEPPEPVREEINELIHTLDGRDIPEEE
jgi:hypothetical protein